MSSASIACAGHAGNTAVMTGTARRAAAFGVAVGAHPSYPDRDGFGRRELSLPIPEIVASFRAQVESMMMCAELAGTKVTYVKPHGALYNRAMNDRALADALASSVAGIDPGLALLSLPDGELAAAARRAGLYAVREGFIDRAYDAERRLVARSHPAAVLHDIEEASTRAVRIASGEPIMSVEGQALTLEVDSLCVHSDSTNAREMMAAVRRKLESAGFAVTPFAGRT